MGPAPVWPRPLQADQYRQDAAHRLPAAYDQPSQRADGDPVMHAWWNTVRASRKQRSRPRGRRVGRKLEQIPMTRGLLAAFVRSPLSDPRETG